MNIKAILRAIIKDIQAGRFKEGASTLTQQLAKTLFLTNEKSIARKIKELILSIQIERRYTKEEILTLYLNQIYLGAGTYGVEAAARTYFGRSVTDIDLAQAALLAGLPKAPSIYSPLRNPDLAKKRRDLVLHQMQITGKITKAQESKAVSAPLMAAKTPEIRYSAGYFVGFVKSFLKDQFDLQQVYSNGLNIQTTLRTDLQEKASQAVAKHMADLEKRMKDKNLDTGALQCALVAIDIKTGAILAMIGGRDFNKSHYNRAVQARRQPGSAFKPFVFAAAVFQGAQQNDLIVDAPLSYPVEKNQIWQVNNFSKTFGGEMTLRKALALSKNTPAIRLLERVGIKNVVEFAQRMGIMSTLSLNLSLGLGTSEVSLMELTAGYVPFANMGIRVSPFAVERITDTQSRLVYRHSMEKKTVLLRRHAAIIADMLKAVITEGTGKKARSIKRDIAGKTGTTDNYKDALFIGFSADLALGVWVGNDTTKSLGRYETGAKAALPIWVDVMQHHLSGQPAQYFDIPDGLNLVHMDPDTGKISKQPFSGSVKALLMADE